MKESQALKVVCKESETFGVSEIMRVDSRRRNLVIAVARERHELKNVPSF